jgi:hypothetical protein
MIRERKRVSISVSKHINSEQIHDENDDDRFVVLNTQKRYFICIF